MMRSVFVGHDMREATAYRVCVRSMRERSPGGELLIAPISTRTLGDAYKRPISRREGVLWDDISDAPMATEFSLARFFVPTLAATDWALFCDCDFMWRADVEELFALADDRFAVMVVKHAHHPVETVKMDGQIQTAYARKNWSSCMLVNCGAEEWKRVRDGELVNTETGRYLHGFQWIADDRIGELPAAWNWLAGVNRMPDDGEPKAVHYTLGTPDMKGFEDSPFAEEWRRYESR